MKKDEDTEGPIRAGETPPSGNRLRLARRPRGFGASEGQGRQGEVSVADAGDLQRVPPQPADGGPSAPTGGPPWLTPV